MALVKQVVHVDVGKNVTHTRTGTHTHAHTHTYTQEHQYVQANSHKITCLHTIGVHSHKWRACRRK